MIVRIGHAVNRKLETFEDSHKLSSMRIPYSCSLVPLQDIIRTPAGTRAALLRLSEWPFKI
jgi:hypothetical protein